MVIENLRFLTLLFLFLVAFSCSVESTKTSSVASEFIMPSASEEDLIKRCAPWFYDNPIDTGQIQHNQLVNLIIDQGWDLQVTKSGIFYHILQKGDGLSVIWGDRVSVHYTGYDLNLQPFHSTRRANTPFEFYLGNVISGWNDGLPLINEGGRLLLLIPSYKAYGTQGFGDLVAPNQHLIFDIELLQKLNDSKKL
ncbi:MAG: FKBP-type peptidyl-prolyl cis-trans isomerase [Saprospiraceae bacterium]|nr:FKBP-type peptidyl-prolyl cis-trans isomerase [Saprospiraceae bacterium]